MFKDEIKGRGEKRRLPLGVVRGADFIKGEKVFSYGNYRAYYAGRRELFSTSPNQIDDRLLAITSFKTDVFKDKRVLDVGCNEGLISFTVSCVYRAACVVGVDVDTMLIESCLKSLRALKSQQHDGMLRHTQEQSGANNSEAVLSNISHQEDTEGSSNQIINEDAAGNCEPSIKPDESMERLPTSTATVTMLNDLMVNKQEDRGTHTTTIPPTSDLTNSFFFKFPYSMEFRAEDFVRSSVDEDRIRNFGEGCLYDVILMFSVTKWIHFHSGDKGIFVLFRKAHKLLRKGGLLILEPQNWQSYRKKRRIRDHIKQTVASISFKPHNFDKFLTTAKPKHTSDYSWRPLITEDMDEVYDKSDEFETHDVVITSDNNSSALSCNTTSNNITSTSATTNGKYDSSKSTNHNACAVIDPTCNHGSPPMFRRVAILSPKKDNVNEDNVGEEDNVVKEDCVNTATSFQRPIFMYEKL